jgi:hypothetical protein
MKSPTNFPAKSTHLSVLRISALAGVVLSSDLQAGSVCAESAVLPVETRLFGTCAESGVVSVDTRTSFDIWLAPVGLSLDLREPLAIPFQDGVSNLGKYAFNLNRAAADNHNLSPSGTSGLPYHRVVEGHLRLTSLRRKDDPALSYRAYFSHDLNTWSEVVLPLQIESLDTIWDRVTFESPANIAPETKLFGRMGVGYLPP